MLNKRNFLLFKLVSNLMANLGMQFKEKSKISAQYLRTELKKNSGTWRVNNRKLDDYQTNTNCSHLVFNFPKFN